MTAPKPETQGQAEAWQKVCRLAERVGLCSQCAAQLAWGAQEGSGGFSSIHPPCAQCTIVMLEWPVARANGRRTPRGTLSAPSTWSQLPSGERTTSPAADPAEV